MHLYLQYWCHVSGKTDQDLELCKRDDKSIGFGTQLFVGNLYIAKLSIYAHRLLLLLSRFSRVRLCATP